MSDEAPTVIKVELNCSRINKARLFRKEGKEGAYLKVVLIKRKERDKFGRVAYMVKEDVPKGEEGNFIGDGNVPIPKNAPAPPPATTTAPGQPGEAAPTARKKKLPF